MGGMASSLIVSPASVGGMSSTGLSGVATPAFGHTTTTTVIQGAGAPAATVSVSGVSSPGLVTPASIGGVHSTGSEGMGTGVVVISPATTGGIPSTVNTGAGTPTVVLLPATGGETTITGVTNGQPGLMPIPVAPGGIGGSVLMPQPPASVRPPVTGSGGMAFTAKSYRCNSVPPTENCLSTVKRWYYDPSNRTCVLRNVGRCKPQPAFLLCRRCVMTCMGIKSKDTAVINHLCALSAERLQQDGI
ncbi:uncharacterized protein [Dermacentor andersoni]|uniref:uncharacterized protein n=1 Tax=Dermacentor andersoni TaxID=34620 RepID=UPI002415A12A|nr:uncharacterized protein LOC126534921 [Dermacentor andersoni]